MGGADNLITLVVHTEEHALKLKKILEFHDIPVVLEDVATDGLSLQGAPQKVRIPVSSLQLGLKIIESGDKNLEPLGIMKMTGMGTSLLIPVDFNNSSWSAVRVGFYLAEKFGIEPVLLHSYVDPSFYSSSYPSIGETDIKSDDSDAADDIRKNASLNLSRLKNKIEKAQLDGRIPNIKFSTTLLEGVPEQVIQEYCKENKPLLIAMATRDIYTKNSDLVGSVTAEVIDSCRVPVLSLPGNIPDFGIESIKRAAMFCTFSAIDTLLMRWLMRTFDYPAIDFKLIPISDRTFSKVDDKLEWLKNHFNKVYPTANYSTAIAQGTRFDDKVKFILENHQSQLIIVPNKKSSAFTRFFKPTLAHRILFEKDLPLLVIPV